MISASRQPAQVAPVENPSSSFNSALAKLRAKKAKKAGQASIPPHLATQTSNVPSFDVQSNALQVGVPPPNIPPVGAPPPNIPPVGAPPPNIPLVGVPPPNLPPVGVPPPNIPPVGVPPSSLYPAPPNRANLPSLLDLPFSGPSSSNVLKRPHPADNYERIKRMRRGLPEDPQEPIPQPSFAQKKSSVKNRLHPGEIETVKMAQQPWFGLVTQEWPRRMRDLQLELEVIYLLIQGLFLLQTNFKLLSETDGRFYGLNLKSCNKETFAINHRFFFRCRIPMTIYNNLSSFAPWPSKIKLIVMLNVLKAFDQFHIFLFKKRSLIFGKQLLKIVL